MAKSLFSRLLIGGSLAVASLGATGCKAKPSEKACKEAIENVRFLTKQSMSDVGADPKAAIRSCRANSSKESVQCMIDAKSEEDLAKCEGELGAKYFEAEKEQHEKGMEKTEEKKAKDAAKGAEEDGDEAAPEETSSEETAAKPEAKADEAAPEEKADDEAKADEAKPEEKADDTQAAPGGAPTPAPKGPQADASI